MDFEVCRKNTDRKFIVIGYSTIKTDTKRKPSKILHAIGIAYSHEHAMVLDSGLRSPKKYTHNIKKKVLERIQPKNQTRVPNIYRKYLRVYEIYPVLRSS